MYSYGFIGKYLTCLISFKPSVSSDDVILENIASQAELISMYNQKLKIEEIKRKLANAEHDLSKIENEILFRHLKK